MVRHEYLNSKHPNINPNNNNSFITSVYRKPSFTGLMTKFSSFIPVSYKRKLISTLVSRAYHICSNYSLFHQKLQHLKQIMCQNGFAWEFTERYIGHFLNKLFASKPQSYLVKKKDVYFSIDFVGKRSFSLKKKLTRKFQEFYPQVNIRVVFRAGWTIRSFLRFKDSIPKELQASVVYEYKCHRCNATYIGKTKRHLRVRIFEHLGRSIRTKRPVSKPVYSAIRDHAHEEDHPILRESFKILASRRTDKELLICESLLQMRHKPSLCVYDRSTDLLCF